MPSCLLHGMHFGQYQAAPSALGWPGNGECYVFHVQNTVRWLAFPKKLVCGYYLVPVVCRPWKRGHICTFGSLVLLLTRLKMEMYMYVSVHCKYSNCIVNPLCTTHEKCTSSCNFGRMLSVGAIHFEDRFCTSKKCAVGGGGCAQSWYAVDWLYIHIHMHTHMHSAHTHMHTHAHVYRGRASWSVSSDSVWSKVMEIKSQQCLRPTMTLIWQRAH